MNTSTDQMLESTVNPLGLILAIVGGVMAAAAMGYAYFLVANKVQIDYIVLLAIFVGLIVGAVVGRLAKIGGLRATLIVFIIAFVFGIAGYAARYYFELNDVVTQIIDQTGSSREEVMAQLEQAYPPGGYFGYLALVADTGFSLTGRSDSSSSDSSSSPDLQGTAAWILLGVEALAAGLAAGFVARSQVAPKKQAAMPPVAGTPMQLK